MRITELEKQFADEQQTIAAQQERLRTLEAAKENALRFEADATEHVTELRLAVATERQRQENLAGQRQPMAERATELAELIAARRRDVEKYQQRIASQKQESSSAEAAIESQTAAQAAAEDAAAEIAQQRASRLAGVSAIEVELRTFRNSLDELRDFRGKEEVRQTQLQLRIDSIAENVMRRYQVDLREFETDRYAFAKTLQVQLKRRSAPAETEPAQPAPAESATAAIDDASQLQNIIAELTRQLDNMGPVNLDAVHEYDELEERFRFLETQNNDLTASRRELLDTSATLTTRRKNCSRKHSRRCGQTSARCFPKCSVAAARICRSWTKTIRLTAGSRSRQSRPANNCKAYRYSPEGSAP